MKKHKQIKIKGTKAIVKLEKKSDRPMFPRPAVHGAKTDYKRSRESQKVRLFLIFRCLPGARQGLLPDALF